MSANVTRPVKHADDLDGNAWGHDRSIVDYVTANRKISEVSGKLEARFAHQRLGGNHFETAHNTLHEIRCRGGIVCRDLVPNLVQV